MASINKAANADGTTSWVGQVRLRGFKPVAKSFDTRKAAVEWADALERELKRQRERGGVRDDVTQLTVAKLIEEYLADPETKKNKTYDDMERLVGWWANQCGGEKVLRFNVLKIREARTRLRVGRSDSTSNRYLSAMRGCWNWGRAAGLIPQDLLWPSRVMMKEPTGRVRFLSDEELSRVFEAAEPYPVVKAAIVVSLATGVRQGELLRLKWSDIDLKGNKLTLRITKTGKPRSVYLAPTAVAALEGLRGAKVVSTGAVFLADGGKPLKKSWLETRWYKIRTAAKLADFHWHDLRHSCASYLAQSGASLLEIGAVLGHSSPSVTQRYSHLVEGKAVTGHTKLDEKLRR